PASRNHAFAIGTLCGNVAILRYSIFRKGAGVRNDLVTLHGLLACPAGGSSGQCAAGGAIGWRAELAVCQHHHGFGLCNRNIRRADSSDELTGTALTNPYRVAFGRGAGVVAEVDVVVAVLQVLAGKIADGNIVGAVDNIGQGVATEGGVVDRGRR